MERFPFIVGILQCICLSKELVDMVKQKINNTMVGRLQTEPAVGQRLDFRGVLRSVQEGHSVFWAAGWTQGRY